MIDDNISFIFMRTVVYNLEKGNPHVEKEILSKCSKKKVIGTSHLRQFMATV